MVIISPRTGVVGPLTNGRTSWLINGGDPNYLLSGGPSSKKGALGATNLGLLWCYVFVGQKWTMKKGPPKVGWVFVGG